MTPFKTVFGVDLRALALFRIGLGVYLLIDLIGRFRDLEAHYSDNGILPRALLNALGYRPLSLHLLSGTPAFQAFLFVVIAGVAFALILGILTRFATFAAWAFLTSLIARNTLVGQGGDVVLLLMLFWSLFLPLGARYSIDALIAAESPPKSSEYWSIATTALLLQIMATYFFGALLKTGTEWYSEGTAIAYAVRLDLFATPLGIWLRGFPAVTKGLTLYVFYLELLASFLIFSPLFFGTLRWVTVVGLAGLHLGIASTMNVGLFPLINLIALIVFLPPGVWSWLEGRLQGWTWVRSGKAWLEQRAQAKKLQPLDGFHFGPLGKATSVVVGVLMMYMLILNVETIPGVAKRWPNGLRPIGRSLGLNQRWDMFAPAPPKFDAWFVARGELGRGDVVDLLEGTAGEPDMNKPPAIMRYYRWRKYLSNLAEAKYKDYRPAYGDYLCRVWNGSHEPASRLGRLKLYVRTKSNELGGQIPKQETFLVLVHSCPAGPPS